MKYSFLVLFAVWTTQIHAQSNPATQKIEDEIKNVLTNMWASIEEGDISAYAVHLHPDFTVFGETNTFLAKGKELEVANVSKWLEDAENVHTEMHHPEVTVHGDIAWITYYWSDSGTDRGHEFSSKGKSTRIFVRERNRWLCIHAHHTLIP